MSNKDIWSPDFYKEMYRCGSRRFDRTDEDVMDKEELLAGIDRRDRGAEMEAEVKSLAEKAMAGLVAAGLDPVPDAPSEIAVTDALASWQQWAGYYSAYFERDVIPPPPLSAQLDAERARAEAAEARAELAEAACADRRGWMLTAEDFASKWSEARAQIVRLMAERDEARNLLNMGNDEVTRLQSCVFNPKSEPEPTHNPFREFGGDRRRVGG